MVNDRNGVAYDVVVIGAGSAGLAAADGAAAQGLRVALVERDIYLGGDCPNYACIPTKTLLYASKLYTLAEHAEEFGIHLGDLRLDYVELKRHKDHMIAQTGARARTEESLARQGITLRHGSATFVDHHTIRVGKQTIAGRQFVLATGARPQIPMIPGLDSVPYLTSRTAVELTTLPRSILILGAGAVGVEFAQLWSAFGADVTLIEAEPQILPGTEPELATLIADHLAGYGVEIVTGTRIEAVEGRNGSVQLQGKNRTETVSLTGERLLVAVGTAPTVDGLNLSAVDVTVNKRGISVDQQLRTSAPHIWAVGDVTELEHYTNAAHVMGAVVGWNVGGKAFRSIDFRVFPRLVFTHLELASVGITESQGLTNAIDVVTGLSQVGTLGRALTDLEPNGLVKLVVDAHSGEVLGGTIAAPRAGEMIHEIALAMQLHASAENLAMMIHAFPTYSEAIADAAYDAVTKLTRPFPGRSKTSEG